MKTIAIVYDRELDVGGVETHLLSLFHHIDRQRYSYCVIAPASQRFQAKGGQLGVSFIPVPGFRPIDLGATRLLKHTFEQHAVDMVHAHSPTAAIPARAAARLLGLPAIVTVHLPAIQYYGHRPTLRAALGRYLYVNLDRLMNYTLTDQLIYVSEQVCKECTQHKLSPLERSRVIPNGIDLDKFSTPVSPQAVRQPAGVSADALVITFVGRLDYQKGLDVLLDALAALKNQTNLPLTAWLIGGGPLEGELQKQASRSGLDGIVRFAGYQEGIASYLLASDLFVLPSRFEAMPIVILEALAAGLPCVVTRVGDNAILVEDGQQGLVVPPNDVAGLTAALKNLLENAEMRRQMGERARLKAQNYADRHMARKVEKLYDELLGSQPGD